MGAAWRCSARRQPIPSLSDTQSILLSTASQREDGSLLPLPASLKPGGGTTKALDALVKRSLAEERATSDPAAARRTYGDLHYGLVITPVGLTAIGIEPQASAAGESSVADEVPSSPARPSKTAAVLALLGRPAGATLPELIEETGWLPHTTRAALTGLRKKGHVLDRSKRDDATCYRLVSGS